LVLGGDSEMIGKETETYAVVIKTEPLGHGNYIVELGDAVGEIYEFTVHEETILDYRLVVGKELDESTFRALEASKDYGKAYSYAVGILARRMYTEKEIRQKLTQRRAAEDVIGEVVTKLLKLELLNDEAYTTAYIENQVSVGKKSRHRIVSDLREKGVATSIIDNRMDLFDKESEQALIGREIEKAYGRSSHKDLSDFEMKHKVIQALGRKGFDFYEVDRQYDFFIEDLEIYHGE
jgi:regulatory protein